MTGVYTHQEGSSHCPALLTAIMQMSKRSWQQFSSQEHRQERGMSLLVLETGQKSAAGKILPQPGRHNQNKCVHGHQSEKRSA